MEEEIRKPDVKQKEVTIRKVIVRMDKNDNTKVNQLRFETDTDTITYKPKIYKRYVDGFYLNETEEKPSKSEIPELANKIAEKCQKEGKCNVLADYSFFETKDGDGDPISYRFVKNSAMFDNWKLV